MARGRPTIIDVAAAASVSVKTVSRVINREPYVRSGVVAKVEAAIASLGYVPNTAARSLSGGRSYLIAAFFDNPSLFYLANLQSGAMAACRAAGYHLVTEEVRLAEDLGLRQFARTLKTARIDGVILSPPLSDHRELLALLEACNLPYVRLSPHTQEDRSSAILSDEEGGARAVARHLFDFGHRSIAMVLGPTGHGASIWRREGFWSELEKHGIERDKYVEVAGNFTFESGMAAGLELLSRDPCPTAIFAANDDMAAGVIAAAARRGIRVPEDVSVVGFDDSPAAQMTWPPLTTVRQSIAEMSAAAARILIERGKNQAQKQILPVDLVIRGSTGLARASSPDTARPC